MHTVTRLYHLLVLYPALAVFCLTGMTFLVDVWAQQPPVLSTQRPPRLLLRAARIFDGQTLHEGATVVVVGDKIAALGATAQVHAAEALVYDLGDATILPGFIELHGHIALHQIPHEIIVRHGVTTVRDVGGPLLPLAGGDGQLRLLTAGPILTAPGGYPISAFGSHDIAAVVASPDEARQRVRQLVAGGASVIKVALEPGGEPGAPWSTGHPSHSAPPWPMLTLETVAAIVEEAHRLDRRVTAHVGETQGVERALAVGVDEWAHVPCLAIADALLQQAVQQGVRIVTTLDTLALCPGLPQNAARLAALGATLLYGAEIAHTEIPWGIDAGQLQRMQHLTGMTPLQVVRAATALAGEHLGLAPLGTLTPGAPADLIAVRGNPFHHMKTLEYPDLVMTGGHIVVNHFR